MGTRECDGRSSTSPSLLERAKRRDQEAWSRIVSLYAPLVYRECRVMGVTAQDASDVVQDVFRNVARGLSGFRRDRPGDSFRAWLATIARNAIRDHFKRNAGRPAAVGGSSMHHRLQEIPDSYSEESTLSVAPNAAACVVQRAILGIRGEFANQTWEAFWRTAVDGSSAVEVATQLGISKWAVYQAKSRILKRLRIELDELLD